MCQFCHTHGEGKKWYLKAENYAEALLSDMERRKYLREFIPEVANGSIADLHQKFSQAQRVPAWLRHLGYRFLEQRYRRDHFGQVVPMEDVEQVLARASSITRMPCVCRKNSTGKSDANYCIGLGLDPEKLLDIRETFLETFRVGPEVDPFDRLSPEEAIDLHQGFEKKGLIHTIWTFKTPFIGAICNCDRADCLAMVCYQYDFRLFFRAEHLGAIAQDRCIGCRACLPLCQFGAIGFSAVQQKAFIDPLRCYGCGICRSACEHGAIALTARTDHPVARSLW